MAKTVLKVENLSKQYRLGEVGTGTLSHDLNRWWYKIQGKEDPYLKIGESNDRTQKGDSEYVWALKDINFEVKQGEVLGIIGKNGAGKSTLLKILSKVTGPTTGTIKAKGRIASLLEVGTGFHPEMTGRENIYMNGTIMGMSRHEITKKLDEIVAFAGVAKYLDTPVKRYSSGMMVRLGFAVAAHLEPEILIVDEVLAVGDAEFQKKAIGKMQDVSKGEGRTVLFVSHNMGSIKSLCNTGILIENGLIKTLGKIGLVIDNYLHKSKKEESKNLSLRRDRSGSGELRFTKYDIINEIGDSICSGDKLCIRLHYESICELKGVSFSIAFFSSKSNFFCTTINSSYINKFFTIKNGKGVVEFLIKKLPFFQGEYSFNILARVNNVIVDRIVEVGTFKVENGDYYKSDMLPSIYREGIIIDFETYYI